MKAKVHEEDVPAVVLAPTVTEIRERVTVAKALVNLGNDIHEPVINLVPGRLREKPVVEETPAETIAERDESVTGAAHARWSSQSYAATELRPPVKTNASMRKRRGEQQGREGERRETQTWTTSTLVAEVLNAAKKSRYTPSVEDGVVTRRKRLPEPERRMKGWLPLKEDGQGFVGLEVRESLTRGGGVGVFVQDGYVLEKGCKFPYFGKFGNKTHAEIHNNQYLVGPYKGAKYLDGDPKGLANARHGEGSALWAGPRVNQANSPQEKNCKMVVVTLQEKIHRRDEYAFECSEPLRCALEITKAIHAGEEVLTNYQWDRAAQRERKCGYEYHREKDRSQEYSESEIRDEEESMGTELRDEEDEGEDD
jgi:hypothetical protein